MRNGVCMLIVAILIAVLPTAAHAQLNDPTAALEWLRTQQLENGSFGDEVGATALGVFAFATEGETNQAGLDWIETQDFSEIGLDEVSLTLIALMSVEADVADFADGTLLARHSELMRAADDQATDALCLGFIARYNLDLPLQAATLSTVVARQNDDGGFGQSATLPADVTTTSLCVHALAAATEDTALASALDFLRDSQTADDGWSINGTESDPLGTAFAMMGLIAAGEPLSDWGNPERTLVLFASDETGAFDFADGSDSFLNTISTIVSIPVFRGVSLNSYAPALLNAENGNATTADGIPVLDANWKLVGDGFGIELDTADDFFVVVVDPFTDDELTGIEIINWTADYTYTGYIVESYLPADVLLWMAEQDETVFKDISDETLALLPEAELAKLPEEIRARAAGE